MHIMELTLTPNVFNVFSKEGCVFCDKVITLLQQHKLCYHVIECTDDTKQEVIQQINQLISPKQHRTFPAVFDGHTFVGGYNDTTLYLQTFLDFNDCF